MLAVNRKNLVSIFIFLVVVLNIEGWRPFTLSMNNVTWEKFSNLTDVTAALSPSGALTVFVDVLADVNHPFAHTEIYVDSGSGLYDFEIMNRTVNFCEFFRNKRYEPLLQIFYKILLENGPWPTACPIRKSRFSIENLIIDAEKLPPYLPERKGYVSMLYQNKEDGIMKDLNVLTVYFEVKNAGINRLKNMTKKRN